MQACTCASTYTVVSLLKPLWAYEKQEFWLKLYAPPPLIGVHLSYTYMYTLLFYCAYLGFKSHGFSS